MHIKSTVILNLLVFVNVSFCLSINFSKYFSVCLSVFLIHRLTYSFHTFFHWQTKDRSPHQILIRWLIWFTYSCQVIFIITFVSVVDATFFNCHKFLLITLITKSSKEKHSSYRICDFKTRNENILYRYKINIFILF